MNSTRAIKVVTTECEISKIRSVRGNEDEMGNRTNGSRDCESGEMLEAEGCTDSLYPAIYDILRWWWNSMWILSQARLYISPISIIHMYLEGLELREETSEVIPASSRVVISHFEGKMAKM